MLSVKALTQSGRDVLTNDWLSEVANIFIDLKCQWVEMVPRKSGGSLDLLNKFFGSTSSLMSILMRNMVLDSVNDILVIFREYKVTQLPSHSYTQF